MVWGLVIDLDESGLNPRKVLEQLFTPSDPKSISNVSLAVKTGERLA